jgi:hypothetical protein
MLKKIRVSFEVDLEVFAKLLAVGHQKINVEMLGSEEAKASEAPRVTHTRHGASRAMVVLEALAEGKKSLTELKDIAHKAGFMGDLGSCLYGLIATGSIRRVKHATYAITKKGEAHVNS